MGAGAPWSLQWISRMCLRSSQLRRGVIGVVEVVSRVRMAASRTLRIIATARSRARSLPGPHAVRGKIYRDRHINRKTILVWR
jgi:hypothetical protein